uniref:Nup54 domain-containing protein n=1 Tax=Caenorhabditis tropicalis TaxID=1561998 RepID=A0A1I7TDH0_9PELO
MPRVTPEQEKTPQNAADRTTTSTTSSGCRRSLFGGTEETNNKCSTSTAKIPPVTVTGPSNTSGAFATTTGGQNSTATTTGAQPAPKMSVADKMAAFRGGGMGSNTLSQSISFATPTNPPIAKPPVTSQSLLTATTSNLTSAASRPPSNFSLRASNPFGSTINTGTTSLFGSTTAKPTTGGLFGSSTSSGFGTLGASQQQQQQVVQQQQVIQQYHPFVKAVADPKIFGNDNDGLIAKFNQVAASLGVGKAPYKDGNQVQTFSMEGNVFEKFVGIGYNKISERTDDEGFVTLVLRHPIANLNTEERREKILEIIKTILASGPSVEVRYAPGTTLRSLPDGFTEICIIAKEGGFVASAIKLAQALNDAAKLTQLESQLQVDRTRVLPKVGMSKAQRDRYLETVPDGVDEHIWKQAIRENPAPGKLLPVPVRGWEALRDRQRAQVGESKLFNEAISSLGERVEFAANEHAQALVAMENIRNRHKTLSYRIIRVLLAQWIAARFSRQIDTDEDVIEARCDTLLAQMNQNHQVKYFVDHFYNILETKPEKLQESMWTLFDMTIEDQHYARRVLTLFVNICCGLFEKTNQQIESLEACRRVLEG